MEGKVADIVALECIHFEYHLLHLRILVVDDAEAILEIFSRIQILWQFECFFRDGDILHTVERIASDVISARTVSHHIPTLLESLYEIGMNIKFMILLSIEAIVGYGDDAEYWGIVGLLHDIDFELYPEEHCLKAPEGFDGEKSPSIAQS